MPLFAIIYEPGPAWRRGAPLTEQPLDQHSSYQRELHRQGRSLLAGPFLDDQSGGIAIVRADNEAAAKQIVANDPAVIDGVLVARLRPWYAVASGDTAVNGGIAPSLAVARAVLAAQPFSKLLGTELISFSAERTELELRITDQLKQQSGFVHGGVLSYLADNALTFAGGCVLGPDVVTGQLAISYCRPAAGDRLLARSHVVSAGQTQAVARCDIFAVSGSDERLCAAAQGTIVTTRKQR